MRNESGFTLIEIIVSLVLVGMMAAIAGMGIVTGTKGYLLAKENSHMAQKAQLAMARIQRELMELTGIVAPINPAYIIYDNTTGRHAIARDSNDSTIKMFDLVLTATDLPSMDDGDILVDNVHNFTLSYYRGSITWNIASDDINRLSAIVASLELDRSESSGNTVTFTTTVNPRNTNNYGGVPPMITPNTAHNYSCFVATAAYGDFHFSTVFLFGLLIVAGAILFILPIDHRDVEAGKLEGLEAWKLKNLSASWPPSLLASQPPGFPTSKPPSLPAVLPVLRQNKGNVLIGLIVTMMIFAALGAGMVAMTGTSTSSQVTANTTSKAYYIAESGFRYAASVYLNTGDTDTDGEIEDDRNQALATTLDNSTFTLINTDGQFSLQIFPYYFVTSSSHNAGEITLHTNFPGHIPDNFSMPANNGRIRIGDHIYSYSWYDGTTFGLDSPLIEPIAGHMNVLPVGTATSTHEDDLTLANPDRLFFPTKNGKFMLSSGIVYAYKERVGNTLTTITDANDPNTVLTSLPVEAGDDVILKPFLEVHSTGTVGQDGDDEAASRKIVYNVPIPDSPTESEKVEFRDRFNDSSSSAGNWDSISGTHEYSGALKVTGTDTESGDIKKSLIGLRRSETDKNIDLEYVHRLSGYFLSYDAQVKVGFDPLTYPDQNDADYAAGLSFRLNQDNNSYNSYGVSFMRADSSGTAIDTNIIPPGNYDVPMIVLWQQIVTGPTPTMTRNWLAYTFGVEEFSDDMESGTGAWIADIPWAHTVADSHSPTTCWTDSPGAGVNYGINVNASLEITPPVDFTGAPSAVLTFWHKYVFFDASDRGLVFINGNEVASFVGPDTQGWEKVVININNPQPNIQVRFHIETNNIGFADGWYIDDVTIHRGFPVNDSTLLVRIKEGATVEYENGATAVEDGDTLTHANGALGVVVGEPIVDATDDAKGIIILNKLSGPDFQGGPLSVAGKGVVTRCTRYYSRHNYIKVFYGDAVDNGPNSNSNPFDDIKKHNTRDEAYLHWPPDELEKVLPAEWPLGPGGDPTAYDYFTLVKWHEVNTAGVPSVKVVPSKYEPDVIIQSGQDELFTPDSSPLSDRPELGLHTFGDVSDIVYFDDFGLLVEIAAGSGFLTPIQE